MTNPDKLDDYKKIIRSVLIPFQKGCYLSEFKNTYREFIGKELPFRELGYKTDIDFLYALPDVVRVTTTGRNQYHLLGIADDKSQHIQKMVARQKPAKLKAPAPRHVTRSSRFAMPPRFAEIRKPPERPVRVYSESRVFSNKRYPDLPLPKKEVPVPATRTSPLEEVISLVKHNNSGIALEDLLIEYRRRYNKNLTLSRYGFSTTEECIETVPELQIVYKNNVAFIIYCTESEDIEDIKAANNEAFTSEEVKYEILPPEEPSINSECNNYDSGNGNIPNSLREKFQKVADRITNGIFASDFPKFFEEVTGHSLDLSALGYRCLNDLIDEAPDIFIRKSVVGSKKDCLIYSSNNLQAKLNESFDCKKSLDHIITNLRRILEAYHPDGIKLLEVIHVYSLNCKDSFNVTDFGFDDIEVFLLNVKSRVPLKFDFINGEKYVYLDKPSSNGRPLTSPEMFSREVIPHDAVFPNFEYKPMSFPPDYDFSKFIPAYTSTIANAGHLYLQLAGDLKQADDDFKKLGADLDTFYNGSQSEEYTMKAIHIEVKASCVAKWPADKHWYRAQILAIPSMQNVQVRYVDYGTMDIIPQFLLRYAKKEFIDLPAQAIRCELAFLKPPKNASKWDIQTRYRILELCEDVPLMAKIEEKKPNGVYSVLLCDTNGEEDVYVNDILVNEGLAEYDVADSNQNSSPVAEQISPPEPTHFLNALQALQAQYFLQAFAAVAPSFAQNENYLQLLRQVAACTQHPDPVTQSIGIPLAQSSGPPGFNSVPSSVNAFASQSALYNSYSSTASTFATTSAKKSKVNAIPPPVMTSDFFSSSAEPGVSPAAKSHDISSEDRDAEDDIFDDDDDEMFQQFCQKVTSTNTVLVKRVNLGDGYKIHVIVVGSDPYASSGDISQLIWNNKEADYLLRKLSLKEVEIPSANLSEDGNEELFDQLSRFNVKGVQKTTGFKSSILLYPLKIVIKILNIFGHPSVTLRTKLNEEINNFNLDDPHWNELSPEDPESGDEDTFAGVTDDNKIERLCMSDLLTMKEAIRCRRRVMLSNTDITQNAELDQLERRYEKVVQRIQQITEICKVFASS